jgi:6-phosphogluconolactonase (cycloisomerase 2 family)
MKRRQLGLLLAMLVAIMSLAVVFVGCDWFSNDEESNNNNGATTSKFVVVANTYGQPDENLSVYKIQSNGTLKFQDNVALSDGEPTMILLHPNKAFLYVSTGYGSIHVFEFNADNGALTEIEASPYTSDGNYINMAITPDGNFLYVTDSWNSAVVYYGVDNTTGELTYEDSYSVSGAHGIAMHPTGEFLFVGGDWEDGSGELFSFAIDPETGALSQPEGSPIQPGGESYGAWVWLQTTYDGNYLFGAGAIYGGVWAIDNVTGVLTELLLEDTNDWFIKNLVIAPTLPYLYVAGWDNNSIGAYKANEDGTVDNVAGTPFKAGQNPKALTVTGDSKYLYVANYGDKFETSSVMAYMISRSSGKLSKIGTYDDFCTAYPKAILAIP